MADRARRGKKLFASFFARGGGLWPGGSAWWPPQASQCPVVPSQVPVLGAVGGSLDLRSNKQKLNFLMWFGPAKLPSMPPEYVPGTSGAAGEVFPSPPWVSAFWFYAELVRVW
jgi:hypothetical protein